MSNYTSFVLFSQKDCNRWPPLKRFPAHRCAQQQHIDSAILLKLSHRKKIGQNFLETSEIKQQHQVLKEQYYQQPVFECSDFCSSDMRCLQVSKTLVIIKHETSLTSPTLYSPPPSHSDIPVVTLPGNGHWASLKPRFPSHSQPPPASPRPHAHTRSHLVSH